MAIFSMNHTFFGRSKHPAGSAGDFAKYITRPDACTQVVGARMPTTRGEMVSWLDRQEADDRKNARVIDKLIVALPIELSHEQSAELLHSFGERMTQGRASWAAAMHDGPGDADNPHAHIIFRDRDVNTGTRVMMTSEPGSTLRFRQAWEQEVNLALERAGLEQRVDCRTLEAQGIDREPEIHVGAGAMELGRQGHDFVSTEKAAVRRIDGENTPITINYPVIDNGKTRFEENEERKERNRVRQVDNGEYPYSWTQRGSMAAQQDSALLWNAIAQKRASGEALSSDEQMSAMAWVRAGARRAEQLFEEATNTGLSVDGNSYDFDAVYGHMLKPKERAGRDVARGASDQRAREWESDLSDFGKAVRDDAEQKRERGMGMEI